MFLHLSRGEDFVQRCGQRDERAGSFAEAEEGADQLETEGEVRGCGDEAHGSKGDLHEGVDERAQWGFFS